MFIRALSVALSARVNLNRKHEGQRMYMHVTKIKGRGFVCVLRNATFREVIVAMTLPSNSRDQAARNGNALLYQMRAQS